MTAAPHPLATDGWRRALPFVDTLASCLEGGLMMIDVEDRIIFFSHWMASTLGLEQQAALAMTGRQLLDHLASLVPEAPPAVRDRALLASDCRIICEEFEVRGPPHSVVRWVAHHVLKPEPATVVICTDITAEVEMASTRERHAVTDALTGLLNRRGVEPQIVREMHTAGRHGTPLSVLLMDIDHFKKVNDVHGHNAGDQVLRAVAGAITRTLRGGDLAARWGGEEFLVMLPQTDLDPARRAGERLRAAVEALSIRDLPRVTISGGVARFQSPERLADLMARADKSLYEAKAGGRNCIR